MLSAVTDEAAEPDVLDLAFQSLESALKRHMDAREQMELGDAFASAAETLWWICTIDDHLGGKGSPYAKARDADPAGKYIPGLRWVRDRFTHALPLTTDEDLTPFFPGPGADYFLHISAGFIWRDTAEIPNNPKFEYGRDCYDDLVAGRKTVLPLYNARNRLRTRTGRPKDL